MTVMLGGLERFSHTLYDSFRIEPNTHFRCFLVPLGGGRTLAATNMVTSGCLPAWNTFVCTRIGIRLDPETPPPDRASFERCYSVRLLVNCKSYWSGPAADLLFDDLCIQAVSTINRVTRGKQTSSYQRTLKDIAQSLRKAKGLGVLRDPVAIEPCQPFSVALMNEQPLSLTSKAIMGRVMLEGYLFRLVQ